MNTTDFNRWCETAVSGIRFKPDRAQVYDELYAHLEDRCADMTDAGVPEDEAVQQTLAAMGSASEVAEQLEQIHRPFWGRLLRISRWLLLIAAVMAAFIVLPVGIFLYLRMWRFRLRLHKDLQVITEVNNAITARIAEKWVENDDKTVTETTQP